MLEEEILLRQVLTRNFNTHGTGPGTGICLAAAAIKHTIPGDLNYISEEEVLTLMNSDGSGRVNR